VTAPAALAPTGPVHVTPAELQGAALTFARALREHLAVGLAQGQLETVLSGARCLEHLAIPYLRAPGAPRIRTCAL
jgi:hypothetical protein